MGLFDMFKKKNIKANNSNVNDDVTNAEKVKTIQPEIYKTIIIKLDSKRLENPDLDIRYVLPEKIEEFTDKKVLDNGYDYLTNTEILIFLKTNELGQIWSIFKLFKEEKICDNDLSKCSEMYISNEENADIDKCIKINYILFHNDMNNLDDVVNVTDEEICNIESNLNIKFPKKLREFYKKNNGKKIKPFELNNDIKLFKLFPLKYGTSVEYHKIIELDWLKENLIPLGNDEVDVELYWSTKDYKVYRIDSELKENLENPVLVYGSVENLISKLKIKE